MDSRIMYKEFENNDVLDLRHSPVILGLKLKKDQGIIPKGCIMSKDVNDEGIPFENYAAAGMAGVVDGANKAYTYDGAGFDGEIAPGSISIISDEGEAGEQILLDDGFGNLYGDGVGTVNYKTGVIEVTFTTAPIVDSGAPQLVASSVPVSVTLRAADTALDGDGDAKNDVIASVIHGTVARNYVKVNGAAPTDADIALLDKQGVWALW